MKKTYVGAAIVTLLVLFLPSAGAVGLGFVDLPEPVETGITSVIVFGVSWIFVQLITLVPFLAFLDQFKMPLAMAISAQLIAWIETTTPDAFGDVTVAGIVLVLAILALFGVGEQLRRQNAPGFRDR